MPPRLRPRPPRRALRALSCNPTREYARHRHTIQTNVVWRGPVPAADHAPCGSPTRHRRRQTAALVGISGCAGIADPASFQLVFDGRHNASFSTWARSRHRIVVLLPDPSPRSASIRRRTRPRGGSRAPGGGDFTAIVRPLPAERSGNGTWQFVDGAGRSQISAARGRSRARLFPATPTTPRRSSSAAPGDGVADFDATHRRSRSEAAACASSSVPLAPTPSDSPSLLPTAGWQCLVRLADHRPEETDKGFHLQSSGRRPAA